MPSPVADKRDGVGSKLMLIVVIGDEAANAVEDD